MPSKSKIIESKIRGRLDKLTKADLDKIRVLSLVDTKISDTGLKELAKLQNLETLHLTRTKITDKGLNELAKLKQLKQLNLRGIKVTSEGTQ